MSTQTCSQNDSGSVVSDNVTCGSPNGGGSFGSSGFRMLIGILAVVAIACGVYLWSQPTTDSTVPARAQSPNRPNTPTPATTTIPTPASTTPAAPSTPSTPTTPSGS